MAAMALDIARKPPPRDLEADGEAIAEDAGAVRRAARAAVARRLVAILEPAGAGP